MEMVDSALKRLDVALSKCGTIGLNSVCICGVRSNLLTQLLSENNFDARNTSFGARILVLRTKIRARSQLLLTRD